MKPKVYEAIVVGGGIMGLSVGWGLKQAGKAYVLLEAGEGLGGVIQSERKNGFLLEKGPNTILLRNEEMYRLIEGLGLIDEIVIGNNQAKKRFILKGEQLVSLPNSIFSLIGNQVLGLGRVLRLVKKDLFLKPLKGDVSVEEFFVSRYGRGIYEDLVLPFVCGIYAGNPSLMSMQYTFPLLYEAAKSKGSILRGMKRSKKIYSSDFKRFRGKMMTFREGLGSLVNSLQSHLKDFIHHEEQVLKLEVQKSGLYTIHTNKAQYETKEVVFCVPSDILSEWVKPFSLPLASALAQVYYAPIGVYHFSVHKDAFPIQWQGFGFLKSYEIFDKYAVLGCIFSSRIFPHVAPKGYDLLTVMVGGAMQPSFLDNPEVLLVDRLQQELAKILKLKEKPDLLNAHVWKRAIPQYLLANQASLVQAIDLFEKQYPGIKIMGNFKGGVSIPDRIQQGIRLYNS